MGNLSVGIAGSSYYEWARKGQIFVATATITAPVIYTTAAGTGGPLLWNNSPSNTSTVDAVILAVSAGVTVASTVAANLGLTGNSGQTAAPTSTTAIGSVASTYIGGAGVLPDCSVYSVGTVTNAGNFFMPTHTLDTGALTTIPAALNWVGIEGAIVVAPGGWCSVAASATATTAVLTVGLMWVEIPVA